MRILIVHNRYQQRGGEDFVFHAEVKLLRRYGHTVTCFESDNDQIDNLGTKVLTAINSIYSISSKKSMMAAIMGARPDIVHVHNFFPTLSPSIFYACSDAAVPVVLTLHNFRILCAGATFYRDQLPCELCVERGSFLPGVRHSCYRGSRIGSAAVGFSMALHEHLGTWNHHVSAYIALSKFSASKYLQARIPPEKIFVKPNFVEDIGEGAGDGDYALFVGRLTVEKGVRTLIEADSRGNLPMDILIAGDGPLRGEVERAAKRPGSRLKPKGLLDREAVVKCMHHAKLLLVPSLWYEGGTPMVALEAAAAALPIVGSDFGNIGEFIQHEKNGLQHKAGDADALIAILEYCRDHPELVSEMRRNARAEYHRTYTPDAGYARLMELYNSLIPRNASA